MEASRTAFGELVAAASGGALVVALFFEWYGSERGGVEASASAWESLTVVDIALAVAGVLAVAYWVARRSGRLDRVRLPIASAALVAVGGAALSLVVVRIVDLPDAAVAADLDGRRVGTFLALAAAAGIVLGAAAAKGERSSRRTGAALAPSDVAPPPVVGDRGSRPAEP